MRPAPAAACASRSSTVGSSGRISLERLVLPVGVLEPAVRAVEIAEPAARELVERRELHDLAEHAAGLLLAIHAEEHLADGGAHAGIRERIGAHAIGEPLRLALVARALEEREEAQLQLEAVGELHREAAHRADLRRVVGCAIHDLLDHRPIDAAAEAEGPAHGAQILGGADAPEDPRAHVDARRGAVEERVDLRHRLDRAGPPEDEREEGAAVAPGLGLAVADRLAVEPDPPGRAVLAAQPLAPERAPIVEARVGRVAALAVPMRGRVRLVDDAGADDDLLLLDHRLRGLGGRLRDRGPAASAPALSAQDERVVHADDAAAVRLREGPAPYRLRHAALDPGVVERRVADRGRLDRARVRDDEVHLDAPLEIGALVELLLVAEAHLVDVTPDHPPDHLAR